MKNIFIAVVYVLFGLEISGQNQPLYFSSQSPKVELQIKTPPPDSIAPEIFLSLPSKLEGYPIYSRDSIFTISGTVKDNSGKTYIYLSEKPIGVFTNGSLLYNTNLDAGENKILLKAVDKKGNTLINEFNVFYNPNADILAPVIKIISPSSFNNRDIKVVERTDTTKPLTIIGQINDESEILGIWINNQNIDSLINDKFYYTFNRVLPDSIIIRGADIYGNYKEMVSEVGNVTILNEETSSAIDFYALLIGVQEYSDPLINDLDHPVDDCKQISETLINYYTFNKSNVKILKNPTYSQVHKEFQELQRKIKPEDNLLIFYGGHGYFDEGIDQGYWLPSDARKSERSNWISNSTIRDYISGIVTKHTLLISDACFSGSIFGMREVLFEGNRSINEIYKSQSRMAMTSGSESVPDKSVFVKYLIKNLIDNEEKYLTGQELFLPISKGVINNSETNQKPQYRSIPFTGDSGMNGDFIFIKK